MTRTFSWSDAVHYDAVVDEKFTVWNLTTYEEIMTSQNIPGLKASDIRLSTASMQSPMARHHSFTSYRRSKSS